MYTDCALRLTELAYKFFFDTLNAQAEELKEFTEVIKLCRDNDCKQFIVCL